jgi:hypothetical protein
MCGQYYANGSCSTGFRRSRPFNRRNRVELCREDPLELGHDPSDQVQPLLTQNVPAMTLYEKQGKLTAPELTARLGLFGFLWMVVVFEVRCRHVIEHVPSVMLKICRAPDSIGQLLGLAAKTCAETEPVPVDEKERELLRNQVAGWRVETVDGADAIRRDWTAAVRTIAAKLPHRAVSIKLMLPACGAAYSSPLLRALIRDT